MQHNNNSRRTHARNTTADPHAQHNGAQASNNNAHTLVYHWFHSQTTKMRAWMLFFFCKFCFLYFNTFLHFVTIFATLNKHSLESSKKVSELSLIKSDNFCYFLNIQFGK